MATRRKGYGDTGTALGSASILLTAVSGAASEYEVEENTLARSLDGPSIGEGLGARYKDTVNAAGVTLSLLGIVTL